MVHSQKRFVIVTLAALLLLLSAAGCGYIYPTFSHQGRLMTAAGKPVNGNRTITYKLYHDKNGGAPVYTQQKTVQVTNGYFNSNFGASDVDPKIFAQPTWLEIVVNGETLTPRQYLRAAPYAASLVSGAAIVGSEPITYTYSGQKNLGSSLIVFNNDDSKKGGSGLTAVIKSSVPAGNDKLDVAAVKGLAIGGNASAHTGPYAAIFKSDHFRGLYAEKGDGSADAAWFAGDIHVTGNCTGCALAMTGRNAGRSPLQAGDLVAAAGVEMDEDYGFPLMLVRKAGPGDKVVGVVHTAMTRAPYHPDTLAQEGYEDRTGPANAGDYLSIAMEGLTQARLPGDVAASMGDFVKSDAAGVSVASDAAGSFGQVMSQPDENGLTWLLLNR